MRTKTSKKANSNQMKDRSYKKWAEIITNANAEQLNVRDGVTKVKIMKRQILMRKFRIKILLFV